MSEWFVILFVVVVLFLGTFLAGEWLVGRMTGRFDRWRSAVPEDEWGKD